jgi:hypothetical protein
LPKEKFLPLESLGASGLWTAQICPQPKVVGNHPRSLSITHIVVLSRYVCHVRYREDASIRAI